MSEQHDLFRLHQERERKKRRAQKSLGTRLDEAMVHAVVLSHAGTSSTDYRISRGKSEGHPPPTADGLLHGPERGSIADVYGQRLALMIEALEREIDSHYHRSTSNGKETREEKDDRLIRDYRGYPSHLVSFIDPSFGSPRSVERARLRCGFRPSDGELQPMDKKTAA